MTSKVFPNNLEIYRKRMHLSQKQVAHLLGHDDTSTLSRLERGHGLPSLQTAFKLAAIYRVPVAFLYSGLYTNERDQIRSLEEQTSEKWRSTGKSLIPQIHASAR
jgi:transcriptional regulator with XRE-family HTH domain